MNKCVARKTVILMQGYLFKVLLLDGRMGGRPDAGKRYFCAVLIRMLPNIVTMYELQET